MLFFVLILIVVDLYVYCYCEYFIDWWINLNIIVNSVAFLLGIVNRVWTGLYLKTHGNNCSHINYKGASIKEILKILPYLTSSLRSQNLSFSGQKLTHMLAFARLTPVRRTFYYMDPPDDESIISHLCVPQIVSQYNKSQLLSKRPRPICVFLFLQII